MGFLERLLGKPSKDVEKADSAPVAPAAPLMRSTRTAVGRVTVDIPDLVQLAGTTTNSKESAAALMRRHDPEDVGYLEFGGVAQREPDNRADPNAVAVFVEGERVGYLPGYIAAAVDLSDGGARAVQVQLFSQLLERGIRVEAWAWLGEGAPEWRWSESERPPMSRGAKRTAKHRQTDDMVRDALTNGGERAAQFEAGTVDGIHYLQTVEPIKQLKRDGRLEEALKLCYTAIAGAENSARREGVSPAPFYTEQAAIILRKLGRRNEEIAVLRRYVDACPPRYSQNSLKDRLDKLETHP